MEGKSKIIKIQKAPSYRFKKSNDNVDKSIVVLDKIINFMEKLEPIILLISVISIIVLAMKLFL